MLEQRQEAEKGFSDIVERFRQKGALSSEKAMTVEELGLPSRFGVAMKNRLGRLGVFVEVDGKYYLSEVRLKQLEELTSAKTAVLDSRATIMRLRTIQMVAIGLFLALLVANIFVQSWELRVISILLLAVWLAISVLQMYYVARIRRRTPKSLPSQSPETKSNILN